jgi:colicin import membrane protein
MSRRQKSLTKGRWRAIALSVLLHGGIVAGAVYGWFSWKHEPPPVTTIAIEGTVVDERALKAVAPPPKPEPEPPAPEPVPEPEPPPVEEQGPPKPDQAEIERKREEDRLAQEKLEQEKQTQEKERLDAEKKEAEKLEAEKHAAAEKARVDAEKKAAADKKAAEKKKAEEAAAAKRAADEKELKRMLEQEERGNSARSSAEAAQWYAAIVAKIERNWNRPPSARPGVTCIVLVSQVQGGDVTAVKVNSCSIDDAALRESVEVAVLRASPLPSPPNQALFERNIELTFAPNE